MTQRPIFDALSDAFWAKPDSAIAALCDRPVSCVSDATSIVAATAQNLSGWLGPAMNAVRRDAPTSFQFTCISRTVENGRHSDLMTETGGVRHTVDGDRVVAGIGRRMMAALTCQN